MSPASASPRNAESRPGIDPVAVRRRNAAADGAPHTPDLHPVLRRVLAARGTQGTAALDYRLARLAPPVGLGSLAAAAERIATAIEHDERIVIAGDFDADGATGSAVCVLALRAFGHSAVDFVVPDRFRHGYGLGPALVAEIVDRHAPALIITVDNGISSLDGVAAAAAAGIDVVVTDHHLPGPELPAALAIVNPNLPGADFPSKAMAGVGVAFYTMLAVRAALGERGWFGSRRRAPNLAELLDLVALGTVADLVPLDENNRILVSQGLRRMRRAQCRPGITALLTVAGRDPGRTTASDLAFSVAPRLNAAGRLDDMAIGIRCLLADDPAEAERLASTLHRLNDERRRIQADMQLEADLQIDDSPSQARILCATDESWHAGVVGLVASRLKERWHRPAIALAPDDEAAGILKGSARSVAGFHIRDALSWIDARHPGLLTRYGGHAMAAGLTMDADKLDRFRAALADCAAETLPDQLLEPVVWTDGELNGADFCLDLATALRDWGPWGQGFPEPQFDGWFAVVGRRAIGDRHTKLSVRPEAGGTAMDALLFNRPLDRVPEVRRIRLVYQLDINEYMGRVSLQLIVRHVVDAA